MLRFRGAECFRHRIVYSTLSGRPIRIDGIRADAQSPGLQEHEASFLRLVEKISNGCIIEVNETGGLAGVGRGVEFRGGWDRGVRTAQAA